MNNVIFINWTNEDFTGMFDGKTHRFEASCRYDIPSAIALHFAKHLTVRELHKQGHDNLPQVLYNEYFKKCFGGEIPVVEQELKFKKVDETGRPIKEKKEVKVEEVEENQEEDEEEEYESPIVPGEPKIDATPLADIKASKSPGKKK